jgi:Type II secretory pathway, component PulK
MPKPSGHFEGRGRSQRGIALLLVIWVLSALTVTALGLSLITRAERFSAHRFRETTVNRFLAEAGIEKAIIEIAYSSMHRLEAAAWKVDGTPYSFELGAGRCQVRVWDETGKFNINKMNDINSVVLKNLLMNVALVDHDTADIIADSVLDWKESDNLHRIHGADDDYYLSLPNPYKPRHALFETPEEILMVRGMTPEIIYGNGQQKGIMPFITIYSPTDKINVLTAPREVLLAIPGIGMEFADKILEMRGGDVIDNAASEGIIKLLAKSAAEFASASNYGNTVGIESAGYITSEKTAYRIATVVRMTAAGRYKTLYYKGPTIYN